MTPEQAKHILSAYRKEDSTAPRSKELDDALALLESDLQLQEWHKQEILFDRQFSDALNSLTPPQSLKKQIADTVATAEPLPSSKPTQFPATAWWRHPATWSIAASILLTLIIINFSLRPGKLQAAALPDFIQSVSEMTLQQPMMEYYNSDLQAIHGQLKATFTAPPTADTLFASLPPERIHGCLNFEWNGRPVAVVCFGNSGFNHLYIISATSIEDSVGPEPVVHNPDNGTSTASWSAGGKIYVLVAIEGSEKLAEMLATLPAFSSGRLQ